MQINTVYLICVALPFRSTIIHGPNKILCQFVYKIIGVTVLVIIGMEFCEHFRQGDEIVISVEVFNAEVNRLPIPIIFCWIARYIELRFAEKV